MTINMRRRTEEKGEEEMKQRREVVGKEGGAGREDR
jgi:hypothetical protein